MRSTVGSGRPRVAGWSRWRGVVTRTYRGVPLHLLGGPRSGGAAQAGQRLRVALVGALGAARAAQGAGVQAGWPVRVRDVSAEMDMSGVAAGPGRAAQQREVAGGNSRVIPHCGKRPNPVATGLLAGYFPFSLF